MKFSKIRAGWKFAKWAISYWRWDWARIADRTSHRAEDCPIEESDKRHKAWLDQNPPPPSP